MSLETKLKQRKIFHIKVIYISKEKVIGEFSLKYHLFSQLKDNQNSVIAIYTRKKHKIGLMKLICFPLYKININYGEVVNLT